MPTKIFPRLTRALAHNKARLLWYFIAFFCLNAVLWTSRKFGNPTIEQLIFHLQYGAEGLEGFDRKLLVSCLRQCVLGSFAYALLAVWLEQYLARRFWVKYLPLAIIIFALGLAFARYGVWSYLKADSGHDYFADHYTPPATVKITGHNTKNLVLIYAESLESAYSDASTFRRDLLAPLTRQPGTSFEKFLQVYGTGWTIGGMTATQCAIPLKPVILANGNKQGELFKNFLPAATCLGDTLKSFGYNNVFLGGAEHAFAGKGKFLSNHGYDAIYGRDEWLATGRYTPESLNGWGLQDDDLFAEARQALDKLVQSKRPFNLTLLTVNTHFPDGFLSASCRNKGGKSFEDIVACSATDIAGFIDYMKSKGYLKHTNVVILGDHLSMPNVVYDLLTNHPYLSIFNL